MVVISGMLTCRTHELPGLRERDGGVEPRRSRRGDRDRQHRCLPWLPGVLVRCPRESPAAPRLDAAAVPADRRGVVPRQDPALELPQMPPMPDAAASDERSAA